MKHIPTKDNMSNLNKYFKHTRNCKRCHREYGYDSFFGENYCPYCIKILKMKKK